MLLPQWELKHTAGGRSSCKNKDCAFHDIELFFRTVNNKPERKIFYGWWMVAASIIMHFVGGGLFYYGFTVFFNPIRHDFGWTAAVTSVAFSLQRLESGLLGPVAGFLVDKIGPRRMMIVGWSVAGLGFVVMSRISALWHFYVAFGVIAMGMSFSSGIVMNTAITNWFTKKRSRALALTFIGPGLSGILAPVLALMIGRFGWRETLVYSGVAVWAIALPLSLVMRHKPGDYGFLPDGDDPSIVSESAGGRSGGLPDKVNKDDATDISFTIKQALRSRTFWLLSLVFLFQQIAGSALMVHIVPYLESVNVPTSIAATVVTGMTLFSLIGRLSFGFLGDFRNKRQLIAASLILQTAGFFVFSFISMERSWLILVFLLTYGPGYGGPIPLRPALQADYFGIKNFGAIMGLMAAVGMVGGLVSPIVAGWVFDVTGGYSQVWMLFTLFLLPSIPLMLIAKPPKIRQGVGN